MASEVFTTPVSRQVWQSKYRYTDVTAIHDVCVQDSWRRVARALASVEPNHRKAWEKRFYQALKDFKFLPGGRILAGAGTGKKVTLFNCFAMSSIDDSLDGIFDALKEGALTMQQGGGIGYDFSTLRPKGIPAKSIGGVASGPVSFMRIWDTMCATLLSTGTRRGAMMATLRCDHPDIEEFINAKRNPSELRNFNLSVLVSDDFMQALQHDGEWPLVFPISGLCESTGDQGITMRKWSASPKKVPCRIYRVVRARVLWEQIMRATYEYAEPGVLFIDRINRDNNLWYREQICTTNPCGEIPLPPYGACNLGSLNLTRFIRKPFSRNAQFDYDAIKAATVVAVRMLDNVIDLSLFPLEKQEQQAKGARRIGLGITGLADSLIMLGLRYGEDQSIRFTANIMELICYTAYQASIDLAREKGSFPYLDQHKYLQGPFIQSLPPTMRSAIGESGIRNSHLTAVAPTGSISLLADNVSNGLEPLFDFQYKRRILTEDGSFAVYELASYALRLWREYYGEKPLPPQFVKTDQIPTNAHLNMQAAIQRYVDNAISKTIYVPKDFDFSAFRSLYQTAYEMGLKGCTTFRPNPVTGAVLMTDTGPEESLCHCDLGREPD